MAINYLTETFQDPAKDPIRFSRRGPAPDAVASAAAAPRLTLKGQGTPHTRYFFRTSFKLFEHPQVSASRKTSENQNCKER